MSTISLLETTIIEQKERIAELEDEISRFKNVMKNIHRDIVNIEEDYFK